MGLVLMLILLSGVIIYLLYFTNLFVLKEIRIRDNKRVSQEEIIKLTGLKGGERLFGINLKLLKAKIKKHPFIEDCVILRRIPSLLEISVREREGLAILIRENRGYLIDKQGVILGGILPQDYLFYPLVEIKDEEWKDKFFTFLDWIKHNKSYLPVFENFAKITLERDKIIFETKNHLRIYFPVSVMEEWVNLYKYLDRIMVYLYDNQMIEKVEIIRLDYPFGQALLKFRS
jgi:cell division protein FtsQ